MESNRSAITVGALNRRISEAVAASPALRNVWVVGETSDVRVSGGHCYMELVEKDAEGGNAAKIRANCWASTWSRVVRNFRAAAGTDLTSGMKVMALVSASYHPSYGMSVNIIDIDASYTVGDAIRRRNEILQRLSHEGLLELNRRLTWAMPPQRIAVISAPGAAGYGDFINQLYTNPYRLRYTTRLFPAVLQGDRTVASVSAALEAIAAECDRWDGVVIIRGGGATTDLAAFDNYDLAARIARFPIPVIVGIGHERDITVLDYVGNMRVKTPTAAAEWLIARGKRVLDALDNATHKVAEVTRARLHGNHRQLDIIGATLPGLVQNTLARHDARLERMSMFLAGAFGPRVIDPQYVVLDRLGERLERAVTGAVALRSGRLDALDALLTALSPEAVLRRGFTITYNADGRPVTDVGTLTEGETITTRVADGIVTSTVTNLQKQHTDE